ncbi:MAG: UDP-N-acetylglucosamine 2-epimerase (non-hydrolyzing) [Phycisphaerales bacterium]|nr:MAG: UDP-N-acetylglucosamine 2-epimerase (non-hydrolyzing) [Phycisphaerales bacterium]
MKIVSIVGARPQFVKAAAVSRRLRAHGLREYLLHTGQHYDVNMSEVFFRELDLPEPNTCLEVGSGPHGAQTGKMLAGIEDVLLREEPDGVIVYGDTNSTLSGALAAVKLRQPLAHVEAGLRSYNRQMPEEINRIVADRCSDLLFCPTENAVKNLEREGFESVVADGRLVETDLQLSKAQAPAPVVINVGDVMLDIALDARRRIDTDGEKWMRTVDRLGAEPGRYVLTTIHRACNTDDPARLGNIVKAMGRLAESGLNVLFPAHPRTKAALERFELLPTLSTHGLTMSDPVSYLEMVALECHAGAILTDSGGVQKEACFFGVPCVVAREETEWTELVDLGLNVLAGAETARLVDAVTAALEIPSDRYEKAAVYGDGNACDRIVTLLVSWLQDKAG